MKIRLNKNLTAIVTKDSGYYVGYIMEEPAAISEGRNIKELKKYLLEAYNLIQETKKTD